MVKFLSKDWEKGYTSLTAMLFGKSVKKYEFFSRSSGPVPRKTPQSLEAVNCKPGNNLRGVPFWNEEFSRSFLRPLEIALASPCNLETWEAGRFPCP